MLNTTKVARAKERGEPTVFIGGTEFTEDTAETVEKVQAVVIGGGLFLTVVLTAPIWVPLLWLIYMLY